MLLAHMPLQGRWDSLAAILFKKGLLLINSIKFNRLIYINTGILSARSHCLYQRIQFYLLVILQLYVHVAGVEQTGQLGESLLIGRNRMEKEVTLGEDAGLEAHKPAVS